ncbi:MAG: hypothetical protein ACFE7R_07730, partial [Candidatus Hodarchaeota archaeon]
MKEKLIACMLTVLFLTVVFIVPVRIVVLVDDMESLIPERQNQLAQATVVLVDESHNPAFGFTHDGLLANLTTDLESHGYDVDNMTSWNEDILFSADVVIIPIPTVAYSMDEYYALHHFVAKGGGLFIMGDVPSGSEADELALEFGFHFSVNALVDLDNNYGVSNYWIRWNRVSNFGNHPITSGLSNVTTFLGHGIVQYPGTGVPLLMMDADENSTYQTSGEFSSGTAGIVALEYPWGLGRIVVTGDSNQFWSLDFTMDGTEEYYEGDNDLLARNIIDWLAGATIPETIIVFDESHNAQFRTGTMTHYIDVLFDETQNPAYGIDNNDNNQYGYAEDGSPYGDLAAYLEGNNMGVDKMTLWDYHTVGISDVLVMVNPSTLYDQYDMETLRYAVRSGLGLLLLGEHGISLHDGAVQIAELFDVEFYDGTISDTDENYNANPAWVLMDESNLADHPSLNGVHEFVYFGSGGFRTVPDGTQTILSTDDDSSAEWYSGLEPPGAPSPRNVPCAIAFQYGRGRVMMLADASPFYNGLDQFLEFGNNSLFAVSAIRWLAEGRCFHQYWWGAQELRNQGYGVVTMTRMNSTFLDGSNVLILAAPQDAYSAADKAVIDDYVSVQGNGLFLISEFGVPNSVINNIAGEYGITMSSLFFEDNDDYIDTLNHAHFLLDEYNIQAHVIT